MKRTLVISDIHGCYDEFVRLLEVANYNPIEDQLILLGDYIDRGKDSKKVIEKVMELVKQGAIALRGNHDDWFLCFLANHEKSREYLLEGVGGFNTLISYLGLDYLKKETNLDNVVKRIKGEYSEHLRFLVNLPYYYETDDYVFVHAGVNPFSFSDWRNEPETLSWIRWEFINRPTSLDKTVIFGHTSCRTIHNSNDIWVSDDKIGIDGACCFGGQLNCLEITDKEISQYHVLKENWEGLNASPMPKLSVV